MQLGDFGIWPGEGGARYLAEVSACAQRHDVRVDFIEGNHEDYTQLDNWLDGDDHNDGSIAVAPNVHWWPRGSVTEWYGRRIGFFGGAVSVDRQRRWPYVSWWPQEEITDIDVDTMLDNTNRFGGTLDVLFSHDTTNYIHLPSSGVWPSEVIRDAVKSRDRIDEVIRETHPHLVVHGHWHMRYRATVDVEGHSVHVEGLGCEHPSLAVAVLDLNDLSVSGEVYDLDDLQLRYGT